MKTKIKIEKSDTNILVRNLKGMSINLYRSLDHKTKRYTAWEFNWSAGLVDIERAKEFNNILKLAIKIAEGKNN